MPAIRAVMHFDVLRRVFTADFTISSLSVTYDGPLAYTPAGWVPGGPRGPLLFGSVIEDADRGLHTSLPLETNLARKVREVTCIAATDGADPYILSRTWSQRFHDRTADGKMILVHDTPGHRGIRWHHGRDARWSEGCQLVGPVEVDEVRGRFDLARSEAAWRWLDARVAECDARGERVTLSVLRDPTAWAASPLNPQASATRE